MRAERSVRKPAHEREMYLVRVRAGARVRVGTRVGVKG